MSKTNLNIKLIIKGCQRENRNSQRILFEHFFGYGMNICLRYGKNREEAEEILNTGFLKAFRHIDKYDPEFPFRIWLRRILVNSAVDYHRAHHKYPSFLELTAATDVAEDSTPLPILSSGIDVLPILQKLPPAYRMVFNLYIIEEYKHDEIAELMGISASASRSNLTRAKKKLKEMMLDKSGALKKSYTQRQKRK